MTVMTKRAALAGALALAVFAPLAASAEEIGTSCADCASYAGAFSIENTTGVTINYQYRWGTNQPWKSMKLHSGRMETHSYPLGSNKNARVPTPEVRFDSFGGDKAIEWKSYRMEFFATGYAGYGPTVNTTKPKPYYFLYASDGRHLDIKAR